MTETWSGESINLRAPDYRVGRTRCPCERCGRPTPVIGILLPDTHEIRIDDDAVWQRGGACAWIYELAFLPPIVSSRLPAASFVYRHAIGPVGDGACWLNHCIHCGAAQDDDWLFGEADVAFMPLSIAAASRIELRTIREPFAALAGGYCLDPPLIEVMPSASLAQE